MKNMEKIQSVLAKVFEKQEDQVHRDLENIYQGLCGELNSLSPSSWQQHLRNRESLLLTSYIHELQYTLRRSVCKACVREGLIPENTDQLMWTSATRDIPIPEAHLLSYVGVDQLDKLTVGSPANRPATLPPVGTCLVVAGVALEIIGWVFLPMQGIWSPVVKGIGIVAIAMGGIMIAKSFTSQIQPNEDQKKQLQRKAVAEMERTCEESCALNEKIICEWMEAIKTSVIARCAEMSETEE